MRFAPSAWTLAAALFVSLPLLASTARAETFEVELERDVEYGQGGGEPLRLDLAKPRGAEGPLPVLVYIHGGAWSGGDKSHLASEIERMAAQGFLTVSVGYRLAPKHQFPAQVEDCKCAIRWLRAHAEELNIDANRIGAFGFSAGAHLAMMLGTMDAGDGLEGEGGWADQSSKVRAVVSYVGPTNLLGEYPEISRRIVAGFIGGTKEDRTDAYAKASPVTYVNAGDAPMLLFQGTRDQLVPYEQAFEMATALTEAGVPGRVEILLGLDHGLGGDGFDRAAEVERTRRAADEFIDRYLLGAE